MTEFGFIKMIKKKKKKKKLRNTIDCIVLKYSVATFLVNGFRCSNFYVILRVAPVSV